LSLPKDLGRFQALVDIIARLRAPDGCPWDGRQTHASLRKNLLEESYEALEAMDEGDTGKLRDELGDLLMLIVLNVQIAAEAREFTLKDVVEGINTKLIHRHPHIFGSRKVSGAEEVAHNWEELKREERDGASMLASVPKEMPALGYSWSLQRRVAGVGFDWEDVDGVIDKLAEEVSEFQQSGEEQRANEFGDLLFTLVNIGRKLEIDAESALREANRRFYRRFTYMEEACRKQGVSIGDLSLDEQNALWEEAKKSVRP